MSNTKMKVITSDDQDFEIDYDVAKQSKMLKSYYDESMDDPITLAHINASIMKSIIDFCHHHKNDPEAEISDYDDDDDDDDNDTKKDVQKLKQRKPLSEWDQKFIQRFTVRDGSLFDIITAANYLGIPILLHTLCKSVIYLIRGKSSQEIREIFKLAELLEEPSTNSHSVPAHVDTKNK